MARLTDITPIPIDSLFTSQRKQNAALAAAAVIIGQDAKTGEKVVVFGREVLQDLAAKKARHALRVLVVEFDIESDDPKRLLALVNLIKGGLDCTPVG